MSKFTLPLPRHDIYGATGDEPERMCDGADVARLEACYALAVARAEAAEELWKVTADRCIYPDDEPLRKRHMDAYEAWRKARAAHIAAVEGKEGA